MYLQYNKHTKVKTVMIKKLSMYALFLGLFFAHEKVYTFNFAATIAAIFSIQEPSLYKIHNHSNRTIGIEYSPDILTKNRGLCRAAEQVCFFKACSFLKVQAKPLQPLVKKNTIDSSKTSHALKTQEDRAAWVTSLKPEETLVFFITHECPLGNVSTQALVHDANTKDYPSRCGKCYDDNYEMNTVDFTQHPYVKRLDIVDHKSIKHTQPTDDIK